MIGIKLLLCVAAALALTTAAEDVVREKKGVMVGAYPYSYGSYPYSYGSYPYSYGSYPYNYGSYGAAYNFGAYKTMSYHAATPYSYNYGAYPHSYGAYPYAY